MTKTQQKSGKCPIFGFYHPTKEPMMCHEVQLSTDYPDDLSVFDTLGVYFEKTANNTHLKYTQHYRIATDAPQNCSCHLHIFDEQSLTQDLSINPNALVDDYDEHPKDETVLNTKFVFQIIKNITNQGHHLDSYVNDWSIIHDLPETYRDIDVNDINKDDFLFYDGQYVNFIAT